MDKNRSSDEKAELKNQFLKKKKLILEKKKSLNKEKKN